MRAKVTRTCNLSDASSVVVEILSRAQDDLRLLSNKKFNHWQISELISQISSLRDSLSDIDQSLDDANNIASGWLEATMDADGFFDSIDQFEEAEQDIIGETDEKENEL